MRTMLDDRQAHEVLHSACVARLGCIVDGQPYIVPINYYIEDDSIYSHSLPGLKITGLRENPRACIQVDQIESDFHWRSAIAFGKFEEITNPQERSETLNKLLVRFPMLTPVEDAIAVDGYSPELVVFRIRIDRVTGVSIAAAQFDRHTIADENTDLIWHAPTVETDRTRLTDFLMLELR